MSIIYYETYRVDKWAAEERAAQQYGRSVAEAATENMREPIIEPLSNKTYLQPARLVLHGQDDSPQLRYRDDRTRVHIGSVERINRASNVVKHGTSHSSISSYLPALQACTRQFVLQFSPEVPDVSQYSQHTVRIFDKKLSDGRTLYIFQDKLCTGNANDVIAYLQTVDSY